MSVTMRAEGQFEITSWDQVPYDEAAEGPKLGRATVRKTFRGAFAGESTAELLLCGDEGGIAYTALERVVGSIGGRAGTFLLLHSAIRGEEIGPVGRIVPDSGTGELRGLQGTVAIRHDEHGAVFTLDYDFA
jgi:hypothetical protein